MLKETTLEALNEISNISSGGMRDAINNLEKVASYSDTVKYQFLRL